MHAASTRSCTHIRPELSKCENNALIEKKSRVGPRPVAAPFDHSVERVEADDLFELFLVKSFPLDPVGEQVGKGTGRTERKLSGGHVPDGKSRADVRTSGIDARRKRAFACTRGADKLRDYRFDSHFSCFYNSAQTSDRTSPMTSSRERSASTTLACVS